MGVANASLGAGMVTLMRSHAADGGVDEGCGIKAAVTPETISRWQGVEDTSLVARLGQASAGIIRLRLGAGRLETGKLSKLKNRYGTASVCMPLLPFSTRLLALEIEKLPKCKTCCNIGSMYPCCMSGLNLLPWPKALFL